RTFIDNAIAYMNLDDIRHQYIDNLSGGQRQRAYIAMTLAQDTDYILLDEPLNNLDMKHSVQIMQVLRKLATELNKTVVIVIHDINFASCYSDYIVAMKNGKLVHQGEVNHIMQSPVLQDIYDMSIPIQDIDDHKIAVYFR
ncbi:MAG: ATP-binding cassette domain-containing protein, partial [Haemophilus parainfluenzae]|nr:ATP-binding cassette domain-containing protein [Haemophilus parainfluenzae]